jgi:hypothetical protein
VRLCSTTDFLNGSFGPSRGTINPLNAATRQQQGIVFIPALSLDWNDLIVITHATPTAVPSAPTKHIIATVELELQH